MNKYVPEIKRDLPEDIVLLFETKGGWNQFGGPEILTFENHKGKGCNVLFNDGSVRFVKPQEVGELNWGVQESTNVTNARRPGNDKELKYWLENMVWYHRFTKEEIKAATGLTEKEIIASLKKFNIRPDNRPKRAEDAPLLVLPYPGGRHPRIGFLDGAIDPQRETKFSVFTPWDANSYVVVDVPEAIWSNLGLTYLAHTHIDTIWSKKGIELPKLEWNRHTDGTLDIERKLPNGISFGMHVKPTKEAVRMELWLKNGTEQMLSDLRVQNCVMTKMAAGFEQQTNENKVLTNPYVACKSSDGRKWIITAWENCNNPWANDKCPCFHSDPKFPDLEPGQTHKLHGWLSFYEGTDIKTEFKRIDATGWWKK
jgi:prepilin-type processing-associated H-X9-DG protein